MDSYLIEASKNFYQKRRVYEYKPLMYEHLSYGGWGNKMIGNWFAFKKLSTSSGGKIPQQQRYTDYLHVYNKPESSESKAYSILKLFFERHPALRYYVLQTKHWGLKLFNIKNYFRNTKSPKLSFFA